MGKQYTFHYDPQGNLAWLTDPKGNKTVYDYSPDGQLEQQVRYAAGQLQQPETTIIYQCKPPPFIVITGSITITKMHEEWESSTATKAGATF